MSEGFKVFSVIAMLVFVLLGGVGGCMWGYPQYNVYSQTMAGQAALAEAESSRQIRVHEARAQQEAAQMLAEAEVRRASGAARANQILQDSLGGPEGYLRYLQIQALSDNQNARLVYVPTEAGLPITEATRLRQ